MHAFAMREATTYGIALLACVILSTRKARDIAVDVLPEISFRDFAKKIGTRVLRPDTELNRMNGRCRTIPTVDFG